MSREQVTHHGKGVVEGGSFMQVLEAQMLPACAPFYMGMAAGWAVFVGAYVHHTGENSSYILVGRCTLAATLVARPPCLISSHLQSTLNWVFLAPSSSHDAPAHRQPHWNSVGLSELVLVPRLASEAYTFGAVKGELIRKF